MSTVLRGRRTPRKASGVSRIRNAKRARSAELSKATTAIDRDPITAVKELAPIQVTDTGAEYHVLVPTCGMDAGHFYVLASRRSLLIEVRVKKTLQYEAYGPLEAEIIDQRISRELKLGEPIRENCTVLHLMGDFLQITAQKASVGEVKNWSELLRFNTRASLGYAAAP
jgi:HSP20 family molecular chaperone IbpA